MPWEKIEEHYEKNFNGSNGQVAKSSRLAFASLYIQTRLALTDNETVEQIRETPSMQYFCGYDGYTTEKPFDSSLMVHFRKRFPEEVMKEISEAAFVAEAKKAIETLGGELQKHFDYDIPGTDITHRAVLIRKIETTPGKYPRRFARIQKTPL